MNVKEEIKWTFSTRLEDENAQEFVSRLPDIIFHAKAEHEKSLEHYEIKESFYEAMKAGVYLVQKEKDPKAPEWLCEATAKEQLVGDTVELWEWKSLARQQENVVDSLKEKLWSAKKMYEKRQEVLA